MTVSTRPNPLPSVDVPSPFAAYENKNAFIGAGGELKSSDSGNLANDAANSRACRFQLSPHNWVREGSGTSGIKGTLFREAKNKKYTTYPILPAQRDPEGLGAGSSFGIGRLVLSWR